MDQKSCRNRKSLRFQDKHVFVFKVEIQEGRQKWKKMIFESTDTLRVKNFIENALSRSVIEINTFLHLTQKFKMANKSGQEKVFW